MWKIAVKRSAVALYGALLLAGFLASAGASGHEIRPAHLELTQLTGTEWRLRFRQPQMMGRALALEPESNCAQERLGTTLAVDAVETEYRLSCAGPLTWLAMPGLEKTLADAMVTLIPLGDAPQQFGLSPRAPRKDLREGAAVPAYLKLGVEHLLFGIDHVCFVLLLVYLYPRLRQLLGIVTSFTLAHSLTLALASLDLLTLPSGPVEALIALSIVLLAREALRPPGPTSGPALRGLWLALACLLRAPFGPSPSLTSASNWASLGWSRWPCLQRRRSPMLASPSAADFTASHPMPWVASRPIGSSIAASPSSSKRLDFPRLST